MSHAVTDVAERGADWLAATRRLVGAPETHTFWRGVDLVAVATAAARRGPLPVLREDEPRIAALVMTVGGVSAGEIAARLGTYERRVTRWRVMAGLPGADAEAVAGHG